MAGEQITTDDLIWELLEGGQPRAITKDVSICIILDMCRLDKHLKNKAVEHWKLHKKNRFNRFTMGYVNLEG